VGVTGNVFFVDKEPPVVSNCNEEEEYLTQPSQTIFIKSSTCTFNDNVNGQINGTFKNSLLDNNGHFNSQVYKGMWYEAEDSSGNKQKSNIDYFVYGKCVEE
jgi:hypothetical protein